MGLSQCQAWVFVGEELLGVANLVQEDKAIMPTRKEILEAWVAGYPKGLGVVTGKKVLRRFLFFRLDTEQSLRMPHELHWEYRDRIRKNKEVI